MRKYKDDYIPMTEHIYRALSSPTLAVNAVALAKTCTMTAGHGIVTGNTLVFEEGNRFSQYQVVNVATNVITLDTPLEYAYTTAATIDRAIINLAVDGSVTPLIYHIHPPGNTIWYISQLSILIQSTSDMDTGKFGSLTALTNGIVFRYNDAGTYYNLMAAQTNGDFLSHGWNLQFDTKAPSGVYGVSAVKNCESECGSGIFLMNSSDYIEVVVQDNLSTLSLINIGINGVIIDG
jgi:hypothetical protein